MARGLQPKDHCGAAPHVADVAGIVLLEMGVPLVPIHSRKSSRHSLERISLKPRDQQHLERGLRRKSVGHARHLFVIEGHKEKLRILHVSPWHEILVFPFCCSIASKELDW